MLAFAFGDWHGVVGLHGERTHGDLKHTLGRGKRLVLDWQAEGNRLGERIPGDGKITREGFGKACSGWTWCAAKPLDHQRGGYWERSGALPGKENESLRSKSGRQRDENGHGGVVSWLSVHRMRLSGVKFAASDIDETYGTSPSRR